MTKIRRLTLIVLTFTVSAAVVSGQNDDGSAGAACGMAACGMLFYFGFLALILGISVAFIVVIFKYIKRDAIARGMPNASTMAWLALLGLVGLVIYLLTRPQGVVMPCPSCAQPRMQGLPVCPQCGRP